MQRWSSLSRRVCAARHVLVRLPLRPGPISKHFSVQANSQAQAVSTPAISGVKVLRERPSYDASRRSIRRPPRNRLQDADQWIALIEPALPTRYKSGGADQGHDNTKRTNAILTERDTVLTAEDVAAILAEARSVGNVDVLRALGEQGRWKAVVWLVTFLVERLWVGQPQDVLKLPKTPWSSVGDLNGKLSKPAGFVPRTSASFEEQVDLERILMDEHPLGKGSGRLSRAGHNILGEIWQSLGYMILADSTQGSTIKPEILEILAMLHNHGVMPESIYNYTPLADRAALRQPPTLHLLSSRILTSLSDAAWRAHESLVVEEAREKGGEYSSVRPEVPGSMYRVRVNGLRHEVWLELVLWACLHGGWTDYGAAILEAVMDCKEPVNWKVLSWRELISPPLEAGHEDSIDWSNVGYMVDTGGYADFPDGNKQQQQQVSRTVSSEVVTSYLDGIVNLVQVGVGARGKVSTEAVHFARKVKHFMLNQNNMGLESTSWDAVVQRIMESGAIDVSESPGFASRIVTLSTGYAEETETLNSPTREQEWQPLSPLLFDGTAATLGIAHRIILAQVRMGDITAALGSFDMLQRKVDMNKRKALEAFFRHVQQSSQTTDTGSFTFDSPYSGIDYPSFYTQLPVPLLAQLLNLASDAGAIKFGNWLLQSSDPDGPTIHRGQYANPFLAPTLIRFAAASDNKSLLETVLVSIRASALASNKEIRVLWLLPILEAQLHFRDWDQAAVTINSIAGHSSLSKQLADRAAAMIIRARMQAEFVPQGPASISKRSRDIREARGLFQRMVQGEFNFPLRSVEDMLVVTACINQQWAKLCIPLVAFAGKRRYQPTRMASYIMISSVCEVYGSKAARNLVEFLWVPAREGKGGRYVAQNTHHGMQRMSKSRPSNNFSMPSAHVAPISLHLSDSPNNHGKEENFKGIIRYRPNFSSIRTILMTADQELHQHLAQTGMTPDEIRRVIGAERAGNGTIQWCLRMMQRLGRKVKNIDQEIKGPRLEESDTLEDEDLFGKEFKGEYETEI